MAMKSNVKANLIVIEHRKAEPKDDKPPETKNVTVGEVKGGHFRRPVASKGFMADVKIEGR